MSIELNTSTNVPEWGDQTVTIMAEDDAVMTDERFSIHPPATDGVLPHQMIPVSKAINIVKRETKPLGTETVKLDRSIGRVLAEDIVADTDLPPFDRSQMDGFAVKASDVKNVPAILKIAGESAAGHGWHRTMKQGEAVRIMTGAPVPNGADSVQKVEDTEEADGRVTILESSSNGKEHRRTRSRDQERIATI